MSELKAGDLEKIREKMAKAMSLRDGQPNAKIIVHMGVCGIAAGARKIMSALLALQDETDRKDIVVTTSGCVGLCSREPMMTVEIEGETPVKYVDLDEEKTRRIFQEHVLSGRVVSECALPVGGG